MFKHPEIKIHSDDTVSNIIRSEVKERTKRLDVFIVEKFNSFERTPDKEQDALEMQEFNGCSLVVWDNQLYNEELSCDVCKMNSVCEDWFSKPESSNEDIIRGIGGASDESDDVNDLHDNNDDDWQSDIDKSKKSEDEEEIEDRMCECRWHCLP